jgi:LysM repeat protein
VERIAARYDVDAEDLMIFNGLTSDLIRVDQELTIPPKPLPRGPDGQPLPTATPTPESAIYLVVVRAGDTIDNISKRLGSSVEAIVNANESIQNADTIIRPGDQLVVPVGTVLPTATAVSQLSPTATPVPTFTPTPGPHWPPPQLLSPVDASVFDGTGLVVLQWLSVGTLDPDEVYVVRVAPANLRSQELTAVTTGTSYHVPGDWLERASRRGNNFVWSVQVARDVRSVAGSASGLWAASPPSPWRRFTWASAVQ